jgi:16S rRNA (guanine527-N7)-methyltransferase
MPRAGSANFADIAGPLGKAGFDLPTAQIAALQTFLELLERWNRVYNLTGIRKSEELVERHLLESLSLKSLLHGTRIADVGTGAGLPGLPLAITEPERHFTLIESRAKRVRFLRHVVGELALRNVTIAHDRAERLAVAEPFATVVARAVAPPVELLAICRHLTAPGSILLLLTAAHLQDAFRGLAGDFVLRNVDAPFGTAEPPFKASIVLLERTEGRTQ